MAAEDGEYGAIHFNFVALRAIRPINRRATRAMISS